MILEVADIRIKPDANTAFEAAIHESMRKYVGPSAGFQSYELRQSVEEPTRYLLLVQWETVEAHTENFRKSDNFLKHRELIGPHFASPPEVQHFEMRAPK